MKNRSYEDAADEFEKLNFYQSISRLAECFSHFSHGELMALRSRFVQLAYLEHQTEDDERKSAYHIAEAIEEVIIFNLKGDSSGLDDYLHARNVEFDYVKDYGIDSIAFDILKTGKEPSETPPQKPAHAPNATGFFKWLSKK